MERIEKLTLKYNLINWINLSIGETEITLIKFLLKYYSSNFSDFTYTKGEIWKILFPLKFVFVVNFLYLIF